MTAKQKSITELLLSGDYFLKVWYPSAKGNRRYRLYKKGLHPEQTLSHGTVRPLKDLFMKDKVKGFISLDLNKVRKLHGNSTIKRIYRAERLKRKQLSTNS